MKKNYLVILMLALCITCVGCGNKKDIQTHEDNVISADNGEINENNNSDSIEIREEKDNNVSCSIYGANNTQNTTRVIVIATVVIYFNIERTV